MNKINLNDIDTTHCRIVLDKAGRVVDGINHGRQVVHDEEKNLYYKIFDDEYCRRENFIKAYEAGFYDKLAPALIGLIYDDEEIVGYVTKEGKLLSHSEFDFKTVPEGFLTLLKETTKDTNLFYYDFVPINIIDSANIGGIGALWDAISFAIVVVPSYFLVAAATNSYTFYNDKNSLILFGNLDLGFGFIGTLLGLIFGLAGMTMPPVAGVDPMAAVISNIAIALITVLYGLLIKYFLVIPWAHSLKDN